MKILAALMTVAAVAAWPGFATAGILDDHDAAGSLREFIVDYLKRHSDPAFPTDPETKVQIAKTSLGPRDPDGYVIYVKSGGWCGSGGCHTLIVTKVDGRFEPLGFLPATELPILAERPRGEADAELIVSTRKLSQSSVADFEPSKLTREVDTYDFRQPERPVGADGPLEPLISTLTPDIKLY